MRRQDFWHSAYICGHNQEAAASSFKDGDAERFSEAGVKEDMSATQYISNFVVRQPAEKFHTAMEIVLLHHLLKVNHAWSISSDNEVYVFELS